MLKSVWYICSLSVCKERTIPRLVYTSTVNAVFTGKPIEECDEASMPHVPPNVVSRNQSIINKTTSAEILLIKSNECSIHSLSLLEMCERYTCLCVLQHIDHYSRTKAIAEQMVLSANGCSLKGVKAIRMLSNSLLRAEGQQAGFAVAICKMFWEQAFCSEAVWRYFGYLIHPDGFSFFCVLYINRCKASRFFLQCNPTLLHWPPPYIFN